MLSMENGNRRYFNCAKGPCERLPTSPRDYPATYTYTFESFVEEGPLAEEHLFLAFLYHSPVDAVQRPGPVIHGTTGAQIALLCYTRGRTKTEDNRAGGACPSVVVWHGSRSKVDLARF
jgi:hypothetical protein